MTESVIEVVGHHMKIGCQMAFNEYTSPAYIAEAAQHVEELGFYGFWVPEHVLFFPEYESKYPYTDDGRIAGDPRSLLDPFSALTFVAAHTSKIKLATGICLVPQRNPVYTAKVVADLDYLSGGRFELGVGIGWLKEEFDALGVPWEDRAGRTLECLGVMKSLWCDEVSSFEGRYFSIKAAYQNPKPVQQPHPPIIFGGESDAALRRVATFGQGWYGFNLTPDTMEERLSYLNDELDKAGRSMDDILIYASPHPSVRDIADMQRFEALGVEQIIVGVMAAKMDSLKERASKAMARVFG
ncbi:MAG: LLM class F420-dependent oxidoreductase [Pseudomonadales bacterium]|nr:LLM class F420-dependent oxidoreductase [Pseudomonadales bacterium]MBO6821358.1 LLM class F420-dependent oxidoreductase [Pseudomonadales bacterium]